MNILLIADTHDFVPHIHHVLHRATEEFSVEAIIHCGDMAQVETLEAFETDLPIYYVMGNNEDDLEVMSEACAQRGITAYVDVGEVTLGGRKIAFTHFPRIAEKLVTFGEFDLVAYGHSHFKLKEKSGTTWLVNPGNLVGWRQDPYFAIYNTESNTVTHHALEYRKTSYHFADETGIE